MKYKIICSCFHFTSFCKCSFFDMSLHISNAREYTGNPKIQRTKHKEQKALVFGHLAFNMGKDQGQHSTGNAVYLWSCCYRADVYVNFDES